MRSTQTTVTFPIPFQVSGYPDPLPAGIHELLIQEVCVIGPDARLHRWTAAYLTVDDMTGKPGRKSRRPLNGADLERALGYRTQAQSPRIHASDSGLEAQT
jgi:hypothetical protein